MEVFVSSPVSFQRPANVLDYDFGDLVANDTVAGNVVPLLLEVAATNNGKGLIRRARISKNHTGIVNAYFRLHLYLTSPTPANGDGGAWVTTGASDYLGFIDLTMVGDFTSAAAGVGTPSMGEIVFDLSAATTNLKSIYGLLEARGAYKPTSGETITVTVEGLR